MTLIVGHPWQRGVELADDPCHAAVQQGQPLRDLGEAQDLVMEGAGGIRWVGSQLGEHACQDAAEARLIALDGSEEIRHLRLVEVSRDGGQGLGAGPADFQHGVQQLRQFGVGYGAIIQRVHFSGVTGR